jgi:hypothetical protein
MYGSTSYSQKMQEDGSDAGTNASSQLLREEDGTWSAFRFGLP